MELLDRPFDPALGAFSIAEARPPALAPVVESLWHFEGVTAHRRERVFPNGTIELIVQLGERYRDVHGERLDVTPPVCLTGIQLGPMTVESPDRTTTVLGIRLRPEGAFRLLGGAVAAVTAASVDLADVLGPAAAELAERCAAAPTAARRLEVAGRWLDERTVAAAAPDPAIAWIAGQIERRRGAVAIATLRAATGLTRTRLATAFREQIGVPPKLYARIARFRHVLEQLHAGEGPLAEVALASGYYDQPHLNAEFRELSGVAPREFLAATRYSSTSLVDPSLA